MGNIFVGGNMLKIGKILVVKNDSELAKQHATKADREARAKVANKINDLETKIEDQKDMIKTLNRKQKTLSVTIEELEAERDDVRDVVKLKLEIENKQALLGSQKESLERQIAALKDREAKLDKAESHEYKKGYSDGVADGLRKISEITQKDRDNAMKIAMVSAASHTPTPNIKEINRELRLSAGEDNK
jgi:predicted RNase H-like nuclease (RuvC/YqgF family)